MVRWEAGARERLQAAALDLYETKGFEETTATEIARAAGLTERTFFRHFADKREVIFGRQDQFQDSFIDGITSAPDDAAPLEIIATAVIAAAPFFDARHRPYSRRRNAIIVANPELLERELLKMSSLAAAMAEALRARGVAEPAATLSAESGVTVFRVAFARWIASGGELADIERATFGELGALTGEARSTAGSPA